MDEEDQRPPPPPPTSNENTILASAQQQQQHPALVKDRSMSNESSSSKYLIVNLLESARNRLSSMEVINGLVGSSSPAQTAVSTTETPQEEAQIKDLAQSESENQDNDTKTND